MPSEADLGSLESTLKASLGRGRELDQNVVSSAQGLLSQTIEFVPSKGTPHQLDLSTLKSKYVVLSAKKSTEDKKEQCSLEGSSAHTNFRSLPQSTSKERLTDVMHAPGPGGDAGSMEGPPSPRVVLYPAERLRLEWSAKPKDGKVGCGLSNQSNFCYMNSVLQSLTYTAPLTNYILSEHHPNSCNIAIRSQGQQICLMCDFRKHVKMAFQMGSKQHFRPQIIISRLKAIGKLFRPHRQEDAHEFLRHLLDGLQASCLNGTKVDERTKETTVINQIFQGCLRSQVLCLSCGERSSTYEPFLDLSLDIREGEENTLQGALAKYVQVEKLERDNAYDCQKCKKKTAAHKRFSIHRPPNVLTIQLNRFQHNRHLQSKINDHVRFTGKLNLRPYMSQSKGDPVNYHLYSVLTHQGHTMHTGHYYCYIKAPNGMWCKMNDQWVNCVEPRLVFGTQAYLLFYIKEEPNTHLYKLHHKAPFIGSGTNGLVPKKLNGSFSKHSSSTVSRLTSEAGLPVPRQLLSPGRHHPTPTPLPGSVSALPNNHKKISFDIAPKPFQSVQNQMHQKKPETPGKPGGLTSPRIVMQIKNGKVTTIEKSPDGKSTVVKGLQRRPSVLVPYEDNDSESSEEEVCKDKKQDLRVALDFFNQEKENRFREKGSRQYQGGFSVTKDSSLLKGSPKREKVEAAASSSSLSSARHSPKKEKSDWFTQSLSRSSPVNGKSEHGKDSSHTHSILPQPCLAARPGGFDSMVPRSDLTLKLNRDQSAGLKKMSVDTHSPSKAQATQVSWFVQAKDSAPSPSLGSCSSNNSNHSVNSTTGWMMVEAEGADRRLSSPSLPPAETALKQPLSHSLHRHRKRLKESLSDGIDWVRANGKKLKRALSAEPQASSERLLGKGEGQEQSCDRTAGKDKRELAGATAELADRLGLHIHKDFHVHASATPSQPARRASVSRETDSRVLDVSQGAHKDFTVEETADDANNGQGDKQPLLSVWDSSSSERIHKKHKKKKHKRDKEGRKKSKVRYDELQESVSLEDAHTPSHYKHKKKKHKRDRDRDHGYSSSKERRAADSCDSDLGRKRPASCDGTEEEDQSSRKRRKSESEESEYVWEERTKETLEHQQPSANSVPVFSWDVDSKDWQDQKKSTANVNSSKSPVVKELTQKPTVWSWDGDQSQAQLEAEKEERDRCRRTWEDHYNEDIDRGKTKKIKKHSEESPLAFNRFQKVQNQVNQEKHWCKNNYGGGPGSNGVPSMGRSYSDQTYAHHNGENGSYHSHHRDHYGRSNSDTGYHYQNNYIGHHYQGSHNSGNNYNHHHSYSHQGYQKRY